MGNIHDLIENNGLHIVITPDKFVYEGNRPLNSFLSENNLGIYLRTYTYSRNGFSAELVTIGPYSEDTQFTRHSFTHEVIDGKYQVFNTFR